MSDQCSGCKHWHQEVKDGLVKKVPSEGFCHGGPPGVIGYEEWHDSGWFKETRCRTVWPVTGDSECCGSFESGSYQRVELPAQAEGGV